MNRPGSGGVGALLLWLLPGLLCAQVLELSGGRSTLYNASGATVTLEGRGYAASVGGGSVGGKLFGSARYAERQEGGTVVLGTDTVPFDLPTDVFNTGHYLTVLGVGMHREKDYVFAGATSTSYNSPFFYGARVDTGALIYLGTSQMGEHWKRSTAAILSMNAGTGIESVEWTGARKDRVAVSAGVGANAPYGAVSVLMKRRWIDVQAAYIAAGDGFRRADVKTPLTSEPDRENVLLTLRPARSASFSVGRQNYLSPIYGTGETVRSSVNQATGSWQALGVGMSGMVSESRFGGRANLALYGSAGRPLGTWGHAEVAWLSSRPTGAEAVSSTIANLQQTLSPRWSVTETVNLARSNKTVGFGGSFLSNVATLSADYQTFYVPSRPDNPFEQALILNADLHLFGRGSVHGGTFVGANGKLLYTSSAEGSVTHDMGRESTAGEHYSMGEWVLRGRVLDVNGQAVMGAAVMVDQLPLYTDSLGYFYVREHRAAEHTLRVVEDGFLDGWRYRVLSAPSSAKSEDHGLGVTIVVERVLGRR